MNLTKEKMIEHAHKHGLYIHPKVVRDWDNWIKTVIILNRCPCSYTRPECPCPQSVEECKTSLRGACTCTVFVTEKYIQKYAYALGFKKEDFFDPVISKVPSTSSGRPQ